MIIPGWVNFGDGEEDRASGGTTGKISMKINADTISGNGFTKLGGIVVFNKV